MSHVPAGFQTLVDFHLGSHDLLWYSADAIGACSNALKLLSRHSTAITSNAACVGPVVAALEPRRRCKVKGSERARFPQQMSMLSISGGWRRICHKVGHSRTRHNGKIIERRGKGQVGRDHWRVGPASASRAFGSPGLSILIRARRRKINR